ncbi:MAG: SET domain-containing protein-lysine N-methyltransferase, partial [Verrucomicrobiota bacterium]
MADSTIPGAQLGLFTISGADTDVVLCTYAGSKLRDLSTVTDESPRYDYLWSNTKASIIIDAYLKHSCFGRYANDALFESRCNASIEEQNGKVYLISTRPIAPNEEIFVQYGPGYWAQRFHLLASHESAELSTFQKDLIKAYHLISLPDGTAITQLDARTIRTPVMNPFPLLGGQRPLPPSKVDLLSDTFGSSTNLSVALSINRDENSYWSHLMSSLLTNPLSSSLMILKDFLRQYGDTVKLRLWRRKSMIHYSACASDGTCGFQLLYQMYLRGARLREGHPPDNFPTLLDSRVSEGFIAYLQTIVRRYETTPTNSRPSAILHIIYYLEWLQRPLPRPPFPREHWMDESSIQRFADPTHPFSMAWVDADSPHSYISDDWVGLFSDTSINRLDQEFTLGETTDILQRNNTGVCMDSHFYPLTTLLDPLGDLDAALYSLAQKLRLTFSSVTLPKKLIHNMTISANDKIEMLPRAYH